MIRKQKVCTLTAMALFIVAAATVESRWLISVACIVGMAICILVGGLDRKRTSYEEIKREYKL